MSDDNRKDGPADSGATTATEEHESFLNRWSRRKALAREGQEPEEPEAASAETAEPGITADAPGTAADDSPSPPEAQTATGEEEKRELPPIESLDEHSDYSAFLAPDVADDLRQKALRKLFHTPKFNLRDGLDDYDLDYTNPAPLGNVITAEMRHRVLREAERMAKRATEGDKRGEAGLVADPEADSGDETDLVAKAEADRAPQIQPEQSGQPDKPDEHDDPDERSDPV